MSEKANTLKMVCVGDVFPRSGETLNPTRSFLKDADITFGQLDYVLSRSGTRQVFPEVPELNRRPGAPRPGGSLYIDVDSADQLKILVEANFNVMSLAGNNSYIWSDEGIIDTLKALKSQNIASVGAGRDINEAVKPAIIEKKGQKIGFLAYCSVVPSGAWATYNKAGVVPLRASTAYEQIDWQPGTPPHTISWCNKDDIAGMVDDIQKLKDRVDIAVVSMHWGIPHVPGIIADYQLEAGHAAIDAGADLIVGHHAHMLKGIEVYKGKVIFYSLGNFCCPPARKISPSQASDFYWANLHHQRLQVDLEHPYYTFPIEAQKTALVKCDIADKKIQRVAYLPLWMNSQNQAEIVLRTDQRSEEHLQFMRWSCGSQGIDTRFTRDGDDVVIEPLLAPI